MRFMFIISLLAILSSCGSGVEEQLQHKWVLRDFQGAMATDEWKSLMKLDTIYLDLQSDDVLDAIWYNPDTAGATTHGTGTWFVVPESNKPGKLVLQWDNDNMDRVVIEDLTAGTLTLPMPFDTDTLYMIFEAE